MKAQKLMCQNFIKLTKSQKASVLHHSIDFIKIFNCIVFHQCHYGKTNQWVNLKPLEKI